MIDWERATELRDEIGCTDFNEIVDLFLYEVEAVLQRIATSPGPNAGAEDVHFLKGAALNLGFRTFAAICGRAEANARKHGQPPDPVELNRIYETSRSQFLARLRSDALASGTGAA